LRTNPANDARNVGAALRTPGFDVKMAVDADLAAMQYALSVYKSPTLDDMREGLAGLSAILDVEMDLHVKLCAGW
jgi:hypothetical protein